MLLSSLFFGIGIGMIVGGSARSVPAGLLGMVVTWVLAPLAFCARVAIAVGRQKGLPWETQRVLLDDEAFQTTYESGFVARVPWSKFQKVRRFGTGLLLLMEGRGQTFLPHSALTPEAEAFILGHVKPNNPT